MPILNRYHDIFRLEIPVQNAKTMHMHHAHNNLLHNLGRIILSQKWKIFNKLKQILSITQLRNDVQMSFCLYAVLVLDKQRMRKQFHNASLVTELTNLCTQLNSSLPVTICMTRWPWSRICFLWTCQSLGTRLKIFLCRFFFSSCTKLGHSGLWTFSVNRTITFWEINNQKIAFLCNKYHLDEISQHHTRTKDHQSHPPSNPPNK